MIRIDSIATRTGDRGTTALADGTRLPKQHPLIAAIGAVDEANSVIGLALTANLPGDIAAVLPTVQNDLFDLGADLAVPPGGAHEDKMQRISANQVARLDALLAASVARVLPLTSFVLPGGSPAAAWLHLARTVVRRAERDLCAAMEADQQRLWNPEALRYLNRLSDACFMWARRANDDGRADVVWVPGAPR
ncbi:MAG: cob(I)yrinic acid a,c-diamide adenosyltransferase [Planctomycetota bacterium]